jgi:hypothetical protein
LFIDDKLIDDFFVPTDSIVAWAITAATHYFSNDIKLKTLFGILRWPATADSHPRYKRG